MILCFIAPFCLFVLPFFIIFSLFVLSLKQLFSLSLSRYVEGGMSTVFGGAVYFIPCFYPF